MTITHSSRLFQPIPARVRKQTIQDATEKYARKCGLEPGFVIERLVTDLGGDIEFSEAFDTSTSSESIRVFGDGEFIIYLATDTSPLRDRFTIAHEIGHYLIHYPIVVEKYGKDSQMFATRYVDEQDKDLVRAEWEANWFAASLLMPEVEFRNQWTRSNISKVASFFNVTKSAAEVRAKSLGLITY